MLARKEVSNGFPQGGERITFDVILDADAYPGEFFAWHQFEFNLVFLSPTGVIENNQIIIPNESPVQTAPSETPFGPQGNRDDFEGRRPGFQAFSGSNNGGFRFSPGAADFYDNQRLTSIAGGGAISGRQQSFVEPEQNFGINLSRELTVFRFSMIYDNNDTFFNVRFQDIKLSVYNSSDTGDFDTITNFTTSRGELFPTPGACAALGIAALIATRRRRL
ncbi:MAG: hypothetical protein AAF297_08405 [Planctomycetota bacterium]